jgi:uncharacterized membrane protein YjjB (DUF3815 family)
MDSFQSIALVSVALCGISLAIGWMTKSYVWPALWSALVIVVPGPAFVGSFVFGLLAAYIARNRKSDPSKERS